MKYKKLLVLITCLLFVTVAVFCFASAFKITDVELNYNVLENSSEDLDGKCSEYLEKYNGKNLVFVNLDKVKEEMCNLSGYVEVVSIEKNFPNKLSVSVKEKLEAFVIQNDDSYFALDVNFNVLAQKSSAKNNVDGNDNILLELSRADYQTDLSVRGVLEIYDGETAGYLKDCAEYLYSMRENLVKVSVTTKKDGAKYKTLTLYMREGVTFTLMKANESSLDKLKATYEFYKDLSNKGHGDYITVLEDSGKISIKQ